MSRLALLVLALRACAPAASAQATPWTPHVLSHPYRGADGIDLHDVDGDGYLDLAVAWEAGRQLTVTRGGQPWHPLGAGTIAIDWYSGARAYEDVRVRDFDGDAQPDYAGAAEGTGPGVHVFRSRVDYAYARARYSELHHWQTVTSCDLDGDGDEDLIAAGAGVLWWWQARDASPGAWTQRQIGTPSRALWVECSDVDGDGDQDVLYTDREGSGLSWAANPGSIAVVTDWPVVQLAGGGGANIACAGDIDGDGDTDYVVPREDGTLAWIERPALYSDPWPEHAIAAAWTTGASTIAKGCALGDLDGDQTLDLIVTLWDPDPLVTPERVRVAWGLATWAVLDGTVTKTDEPVIVDCDGDGAADVAVTDEVSNSAAGGGLICLENPR